MKINFNEKIIKKYYQISKLIKNESNEYTLLPRQITQEELSDNVSGKYIVSKVINQVSNMNFHYTLEYDNGKIYISSFQEINRSKKLEVLVQIANFFYRKSETKRKLNSYLYLTNLERKLDQLIPSFFGVNQVNGGYTSGTDNNRKMVVWRKEDGIKVFIHEMIHFYRLDIYFLNNFYISINNLAKKKICKNDDYVFEAFTDFFAINYYCIYILLISDDHSMINLFSIFEKELDYIEKQAIKVLYYVNIKENVIDNETNLYCYYLLKYYLFLIYRNTDFFKITKSQLKKIVDNSIAYFKQMNFIKPDNDVMSMVWTQVKLN